MKTVIKVFSILRIIAYVFVSLVLILAIVSCFGLSEEYFNEFAKNAGLEITKSDLSVLGIIYIILLIYIIACIVLSALTIKKVSEPLEAKPVVYGVLNFIFCGLLTGIFLLCLNPDVEEKPEKN